METPDPPSDTPGASQKVFLTPHDIPRILRVDVDYFQIFQSSSNPTSSDIDTTFLGWPMEISEFEAYSCHLVTWMVDFHAKYREIYIIHGGLLK